LFRNQKNLESGSSVRSFLNFLKYELDLDEQTWNIAIVLLNRFCEKNMIYLKADNIHRLLISTILIAYKFHEDQTDLSYRLKHFAKVAGIGTYELIRLEMCFLKQIEYKIYINNLSFK